MIDKTDAPFECILNYHACYKTVNAVVAASFFSGILSISTSFRIVIYQTDETPMSKCIFSCLPMIWIKNGGADDNLL